MNFFSWLFRRKPKKVKLGLALGSGGAKGFAELGIMKAFEENNISFDVIAGTSIGSIIGAFLADGYTSTDIYELLKRLDYSEIKSTFMIGMDTSGLYSVLTRHLGGKKIEELKKPFYVVTTELDTGDEVDFNTGDTALCLSASSSYPPYFKPVIIDGKRYIDGAFVNSVPSDLAKKLGADYVVGVDLANHNAKPGLIEKIFPTYKSKVEVPWEKGYKYADIMLKPNLDEYKAISFKSADEMYEIGYETALKEIPKIKKDIDNFFKKKK